MYNFLFIFRASDDNPIPVFLSRCIEFIETEGVATEGLYRVPGNRYYIDLVNRKIVIYKIFTIFLEHMLISSSKSLTKTPTSIFILWILPSMLRPLLSKTSSSNVCHRFCHRFDDWWSEVLWMENIYEILFTGTHDRPGADCCYARQTHEVTGDKETLRTTAKS